MGILEGKKGVILGVANDRSIGWGIAQAARREGARLGFNFLGDALEKRVRPLAASVQGEIVEPLDVTDDAQTDAYFAVVEKTWGSLDFLVHSIAYADKETLRGRFMDTPRAAFMQALDISAYSFISVARRAARLMTDGGTMLTLSYLGSVRAVPNYNLMGVAKAALEASTRYLAADLGRDNIRVNAISSGPIKTLAASGVANFRSMLRGYSAGAALKRNVTQDEVGNSAVYLLSSLSSAVTGEIHYVDAGFNFGVGNLNLDDGE